MVIPARATAVPSASERRSAISILQSSKSMVASAGSVVLAITDEASFRLRCIGKKII